LFSGCSKKSEYKAGKKLFAGFYDFGVLYELKGINVKNAINLIFNNNLNSNKLYKK
jgi:hypothetical protein